MGTNKTFWTEVTIICLSFKYTFSTFKDPSDIQSVRDGIEENPFQGREEM